MFVGQCEMKKCRQRLLEFLKFLEGLGKGDLRGNFKGAHQKPPRVVGVVAKGLEPFEGKCSKCVWPGVDMVKNIVDGDGEFLGMFGGGKQATERSPALFGRGFFRIKKGAQVVKSFVV